MKSELQKHFEANMLDGDSVFDCGKAMISAESVWEYLKEYCVLAAPSKQALDKIDSHLHPVFSDPKYKWLNTDALQRAFGEGNNYAVDKMKHFSGTGGLMTVEKCSNKECQEGKLHSKFNGPNCFIYCPDCKGLGVVFKEVI